MTKMIAQLWSGNLEPARHSGKNNAEIQELENLMQRNLEKLENNLTEHQKKIFENYNNCLSEYIILTAEQAFCDGYCVGTKLAAEALTEADGLLQV